MSSVLWTAALSIVLWSSVTVLGSSIDFQVYHTTDQILQSFKATAGQHPSLLRYDVVPDSLTDDNLPVVTITDFSADQKKEVILLVAGEHPAELCPAEILYWLGKVLTGQGEELAEWPAFQPVQAAAWKNGWTKTTLAEWATALLKQVEFRVLPVASILGRQVAEDGAHCQQQTAAGVDLNRNWPYGWQQGTTSSPDYGGPSPLSEPATRIIKLVAETCHPHAFVSLQSGAWGLHVPPAEADQAGGAKDVRELTEKLQTYCDCGSPAGLEGAGTDTWRSEGTAAAYMQHDLHVPYAMTWQVYGEGSGHLGKSTSRRLLQDASLEANATAAASPQVSQAQGTPPDCLQASNPVGREEYEEVVARWVGALLVLADHVAARPRGSAASRQAQQIQLPLPPTPPFKQDLARLGKVAIEEHQNPELHFVKEAQTVAAQEADAAQQAEATEVVQQQQQQHQKHGTMRRAELLALGGDLPQYRSSGQSLAGQSSRGVRAITLGGCLTLVLVIALLVMRVARTQGLSPANLRVTHRRSSSRRQARHQ